MKLIFNYLCRPIDQIIIKDNNKIVTIMDDMCRFFSSAAVAALSRVINHDPANEGNTVEASLNMLHKSCVQAQTSSNPLTADTFLAIFEKSSASLFAKFLEAHMGSSPKFCGGPSETPNLLRYSQPRMPSGSVSVSLVRFVKQT